MPSEFALAALVFCLSGNVPVDVATESASRSAVAESAITTVQRVYETFVQSLRNIALPIDVPAPEGESKSPDAAEGPSESVPQNIEPQTSGTGASEESRTDVGSSDLSGSSFEELPPVADVELIPAPALESERAEPELQNKIPVIPEQKTDMSTNVDDVPILPDLQPESDSAAFPEPVALPEGTGESSFSNAEAAVADEPTPETKVDVNAVEPETVLPSVGTDASSESTPKSPSIEVEPATRGAETTTPIERSFESIDLCQLRPAQFAG